MVSTYCDAKIIRLRGGHYGGGGDSSGRVISIVTPAAAETLFPASTHGPEFPFLYYYTIINIHFKYKLNLSTNSNVINFFFINIQTIFIIHVFIDFVFNFFFFLCKKWNFFKYKSQLVTIKKHIEPF